MTVCIGCACSDSDPCADGCAWLCVDEAEGVGVCSRCPEALEQFESGNYYEDAPLRRGLGDLILPGDPDFHL